MSFRHRVLGEDSRVQASRATTLHARERVRRVAADAAGAAAAHASQTTATATGVTAPRSLQPDAHAAKATWTTHTVFATNTSATSTTRIAAAADPFRGSSRVVVGAKHLLAPRLHVRGRRVVVHHVRVERLVRVLVVVVLVVVVLVLVPLPVLVEVGLDPEVLRQQACDVRASVATVASPLVPSAGGRVAFPPRSRC